MADHLAERSARVFIWQGRAVGRNGDGGDGAGVHDALDAGLRGNFKKTARAGDVRFVDFLGIAAPQTVVGRHVVDAAHATHRAIKRSHVPQIAGDALGVQALERREVAGAADEEANRKACGNKLAGDVISQEPRGARYERGHKVRKASPCAAFSSGRPPANLRRRLGRRYTFRVHCAGFRNGRAHRAGKNCGIDGISDRTPAGNRCR